MILFQTWNMASAVIKAVEAIVMLRAVFSSGFGTILNDIKKLWCYCQYGLCSSEVVHDYSINKLLNTTGLPQ